jgi:hypothetical protein
MIKKTGKVVRIINPTELVVSLGAEDGVDKNSEFLVYVEGDELRDPDTGSSLGHLEIVRGFGTARHVQPRLTTVRSTERKKVLRDRARPYVDPMYTGAPLRMEVVTEQVEITAPFENVLEGDLVRLL